MPDPRVWRDDVWEIGLKRPRARVVDQDGTVLTTANITTNIPLKVFNISSSDPDTAIFSTNRVVANTFFDTLQTWARDSTGFNFEDEIGTNEVTLIGGNTYKVEYTPLHTSDGAIPIVFEWRVRTLLSE